MLKKKKKKSWVWRTFSGFKAELQRRLIHWGLLALLAGSSGLGAPWQLLSDINGLVKSTSGISGKQHPF